MIKKTILCLALVSSFCLHYVAAETILFDYGFNVDGNVTLLSDYDDPSAAPGTDLSGFGFSTLDLSVFDDPDAGYEDALQAGTGLGTVIITITGEGMHNVDAFFDIELNQSANTFYDEKGEQVGTADNRLAWEIDEPSFVFGDITYDDNLDPSNLFLSSFDNSKFNGNDYTDDVSVGLGWDFNLLNTETATITFTVTEALADDFTGFYIRQWDTTDEEDDGLDPAKVSKEIFFTTSLSISSDVNNVPEPFLPYMLIAAFAGIAALARKKS